MSSAGQGRRDPPGGAGSSVTFRERIGYAFDDYMSRGTVALVIALFVATLLVVFGATVLVWVAGWADSELGPIGVFWRAMLATFDPAVVGAERGSPWFLLILLGVTLVGVFVTSILIGILTTGIEGRLAELRKGRSRVISSGHTVILGWSQQIFTVLEELVASGPRDARREIVVLAERDKLEMQDQIKARVAGASRARIVCRTGSAMEAGDLRIASIDTARSIVLLSGLSQHADASTIKTILAIVNNPTRRTEPYHIVAELRRATNLAAAQIAGGSEAQLIVVDDLVARITAQTCRQSGLSTVYEQLLNFEGDEIYLLDAPEDLVGTTYGEALFRFEASTLFGILSDGAVTLDPPADRAIGRDDRLIVISGSASTIHQAHDHVGTIREDAIVAAEPRAHAPERTLILDWNRRASTIVGELDRYVAPGSEIVVAAQASAGPAVADLGARLASAKLVFRTTDSTDRTHLDEICREGYDHVIVLSLDDLDPQLADARTLITLLHLREIDALHGYDFSITSEMVDLRNRVLAQVTRVDDFIVSDRLASLVLSQLAEDADLKRVFDDLFDPEGAEIYLRPAGDYVATGVPVTFATVVEAARRRGETAIGYRLASLADDAAGRFGVRINPAKSVSVQLGADDRVIVIAADG